ncbi:hypothetical protein AB0E55_41605, partial [Amycolatopsis keratiniphila]|uniref:hypothetical protein n=1 Tax=Amycolatopsis keratiniphila TaxID=129921 RepID=UPI00340DE089
MSGPETLRAYLDLLVLPEGISFDRTTAKLNNRSVAWLLAWVQGMAAEKDSEGRWRYRPMDVLALGGQGLFKRDTVQNWMKAVRRAVAPVQRPDEPGGLGVPDEDLSGHASRGSGDGVLEIGDDFYSGWVGDAGDPYGAGAFDMEDFDFDEMLRTLPEWLSSAQAAASGFADTDPAGTMPLWPSIPSDPMGARAWVDGGGGLSRQFGKSAARDVRHFVERATRIVSRFHRVPVWTHTPGPEHADAVRLNGAVKDIVAGYLADGLSEQGAERLAQELATKLGTERTSVTSPVTLPGGSRPEAPPRVGDSSGSGPVRARVPGSAPGVPPDVVGWRPATKGAGPRTLREYLLRRGIARWLSVGELRKTGLSDEVKILLGATPLGQLPAELRELVRQQVELDPVPVEWVRAWTD